MNKTGAVEQHIRMADIGGKIFYAIAVEHVQNPRLCPLECRKRLLIDIGGDDARPERHEPLCRRPPDTLTGRGDHHCPAVKILHHE